MLKSLSIGIAAAVNGVVSVNVYSVLLSASEFTIAPTGWCKYTPGDIH